MARSCLATRSPAEPGRAQGEAEGFGLPPADAEGVAVAEGDGQGVAVADGLGDPLADGVEDALGLALGLALPEGEGLAVAAGAQLLGATVGASSVWLPPVAAVLPPSRSRAAGTTS